MKIKSLIEISLNCDEMIRRMKFTHLKKDLSSTEETDNVQNYEPEYRTSNKKMTQHVGDEIDFYWPLDRQFYPGTVNYITVDGQYKIEYDDGKDEILDIQKELWKLCTASNNYTPQVTRHLKSVI